MASVYNSFESNGVVLLEVTVPALFGGWKKVYWTDRVGKLYFKNGTRQVYFILSAIVWRHSILF